MCVCVYVYPILFLLCVCILFAWKQPVCLCVLHVYLCAWLCPSVCPTLFIVCECILFAWKQPFLDRSYLLACLTLIRVSVRVSVPPPCVCVRARAHVRPYVYVCAADALYLNDDHLFSPSLLRPPSCQYLLPLFPHWSVINYKVGSKKMITPPPQHTHTHTLFLTIIVRKRQSGWEAERHCYATFASKCQTLLLLQSRGVVRGGSRLAYSCAHILAYPHRNNK